MATDGEEYHLLNYPGAELEKSRRDEMIRQGRLRDAYFQDKDLWAVFDAIAAIIAILRPAWLLDLTNTKPPVATLAPNQEFLVANIRNGLKHFYNQCRERHPEIEFVEPAEFHPEY